MKYQIKKLKLGGILDQSVNIIRNDFSLLFGIVGVSIIPLNVILELSKLLWLTSNPDIFEDPLIVAQKIRAISHLTYPLVLLVNSAVIFAVSSVYLSRPTTIGRCFWEGLRRFWASLGTAILMFLTIVVGFLLLIIPGIYFSFWFALAPYVAVLESTAGRKALSRSRALTRDNLNTLFLLYVIILIFNICIGVGCGMIPNEYLQIVAVGIGEGVAVLLHSTMMVVFYFSCRCNLENFDLKVLASEIGKEGEGEPELS